jgi:hypothetical protein
MKVRRALLSACCVSAIALCGSRASAQDKDKLVYADFEAKKENRVVSNGGGLVQLFGYQERPTMVSRFKGQEGTSPAAPEIVRLKPDDPNHAIAFEYELQAPNQYAGVTVEIQAQADKEGKPAALDLSGYSILTLQLYVTGVQSIRVEFISRGQGINISNGSPQMTFKVKPGFNTYQIPLKSLTQPPWADVRVTPKELLKKLTAVSVAAYCDQCTPTRGTMVVDNLVFQK